MHYIYITLDPYQPHARLDLCLERHTYEPVNEIFVSPLPKTDGSELTETMMIAYKDYIKTRASRRRVPYKWRQICSNSLVIICSLENKNSVKRTGTKSFHIFALALTAYEQKHFKLFTLEKVDRCHRIQLRNGVIRWLISKCVKLMNMLFLC